MLGAGSLHLVSGVSLLRPKEQTFSAMLTGFANQQLARNLARSTVEGRENTVRAFGNYVNSFPWQWDSSNLAGVPSELKYSGLNPGQVRRARLPQAHADTAVEYDPSFNGTCLPRSFLDGTRTRVTVSPDGVRHRPGGPVARGVRLSGSLDQQPSSD